MKFFKPLSVVKLILSFTLFLLFSINVQAQKYDYLEGSITNNKTFKELVEEANKHFDEVGRGRGVGYKAFKRWEYWSKRNLDADGRIIPNDLTRRAYNTFLKDNTYIQRAVTGAFVEMGPTSAVNTSTWSSHLGRLTSIDVDPSNPNHIIVGAPNGGVWKSVDSGATWNTVFDNQTVISIFAVEISHANSNHYFAGTSGGGIYKSTDGGTTWNLVNGISNSDRINTITMHPTNANIVFAIGEFNGQTYKSTDGGDNWIVVDDHNSRMYDLEFNPANPSVIYISGNGIIKKSTDTGDTWTTLSGAYDSSTSKTIMLGVTANDSNYLYALQESSGGFDGLYLSTDQGATFTAQSTYDGSNNIMGYGQSEQSGQAPRDMDIIVSPFDKTEVHVAGVETWRSNNSGVTFTQTTDWIVGGSDFIHADVDILNYEGNRIYAGTDGGIFYSDDQGNNWTDISTGIGVREFYRIGASETAVDRVSGGSQDNGTGIVKNGIWYDWMGADGMETFISWNNADVVYGNVQFGSLYKSIDGGNSTTGISQTQNGDNGSWVTPMEQDPVDPNTLYQAKSEVYKSTDGGGSWTTISNFGGGNIDEMKIAPTDNQTIYIADGAALFKTTDGGTNWVNVTPSVGFSSINYITIHPSNENRVAINISGSASKILETSDGGNSWTDITGNLPNISSQCALYENDAADGMYVGMGIGLYFKDITTNGNWVLVNPMMPRVSVSELEARNGVLYIATYGRGLWKVNIQGGSPMNFTCNDLIDIGGFQTFRAVGPSMGGETTDPNATHANWFRWTPTVTGVIDIASCGGGTDTKLRVHTGTCGNFTLIATADDECEMSAGSALLATELKRLDVTAGVPIYIEWTDAHSSDGFDFTILEGVPKNCTCDEAIEIQDCQTFTASAPVEGNGSTDSASTHASWYKWTPTATGTVDISTCGTGVDTKLFIHSGSCASLVMEATADNECISTGTSMLASEIQGFAVTQGVPLYLEWVDEHSSDEFDFTISLNINYTCDRAEILPTSGTYTAPNMLICGGGNGAIRTDATQAVWYEFTAPYDGNFTIYSCNGGIDTRVWIHDGSCGNLNVLDSDDDTCEMFAGSSLWASRVDDVALVNGQKIYIEWDNRWSSNGFDFIVEFERCGCTDNTYCEYDPLAVCDNGTCSIIDDGNCPSICNPIVNLNGVVGAGLYEASDRLISDGLVNSTSGGEVTFHAANCIELNPGFEADASHEFLAEIEDCSSPSPVDDPTPENKNSDEQENETTSIWYKMELIKEQVFSIFK